MDRNGMVRTAWTVAGLLAACTAMAQDREDAGRAEAISDQQIMDDAITEELGRGLGIVSDSDFGALQSAATTCPGKLVKVGAITGWAINSKGKVYGPRRRLGEIQLYYSAAQQRFCARTMHSALTWGKSYGMTTSVSLQTCSRKHRRCTSANAIAKKFQGKNTFKYQAGPILLYGPKSRCVQAWGIAPYIRGRWQSSFLNYCPPR